MTKNEQIVTIALKDTYIHENRRYLKGYKSFSHFVWNLYNPDDIMVAGREFCVHHIDGDTLNDDITNLQKMTSKSHMSLHMKGKKQTLEQRRKNSESNKGRSLSEDHKEKIRQSLIGMSHSISRISNMKKALKGRPAPNEGIPHSTETCKKISTKLKGRKPHNKGKKLKIIDGKRTYVRSLDENK